MNESQSHDGLGRIQEARMLTAHEIREALVEFVYRNCCYGKAAAEKMEIQSISMSHGYRYSTESVTECREVSWKTVPYHWTMIIDGPENGVPISLWDVAAQPPKGFNFKKMQLSYEMPHTSTVSQCPKCLHTGNVTCQPCNNTGVNPCSHCEGIGTVTTHIREGRSETRNCVWCQGRGRTCCKRCNGMGRIECATCAGSGSAKTFQSLQVSWEASSYKQAIKDQSCKIPEGFLWKATGEEAVHLTNGCEFNENALSRFPNEGVRTASLKAFEKYNDVRLAVRNRKVLKVQQTVVTILIAEVIANWEGKAQLFYVYGNEKRVFFPNGYPQECCWGKLPFC